MKNKLILLKKTRAMIIKTLQGQIMLLDTTNKSDFLIRDILVRALKKPLSLMVRFLSLIITQNYSMKQRSLRMIWLLQFLLPNTKIMYHLIGRQDHLGTMVST